MTKVGWKYARLENVSFKDGEYEEVAFSDSSLNSVIFSDSKLTRTGFSNAKFEQCKFRIEGYVVDFTDSECNGLTITGAPNINDLKIAGIKGSDVLIEGLRESESLTMSFLEVDNFRLKDSDLSLTSCIAASFSNSVFQNVSFNFVQFDESKFQNVNFDNITFADELIFDDAIFENTNFTNIRKSDNYQGSFVDTVFEEREPF